MKNDSSFKQIMSLLKPYIPLIILSLILSVGVVGLTLYFPILIGWAIDCIAEKGVNFEAIKPFLIKAAAVVLVTAVLQWIMSTVNNKITFDVVRDVRRKAFRKLQILPLAYLDSNPSGEIVSRVISDVDTFADGLLLGFTQLFTGIITIVGTLGFMFWLNLWIALAVVVITPISLLVARFISKRTYSMFKKQSEIRGEQTALIDETVANGKLIEAFSYSDDIFKKYDEIDGRLINCSVKATFFSSLVNPSTRFINSVVYAAVGCFGALSVIGVMGGAAISVGTLSSFLSYANQYTKPFNEISGVITELQNAIACFKRTFRFINETPEIPDKSDAEVLYDVKGSIRLKSVDFSYVKNRELIKNFNLTVSPGMRVAIVGPTGCGKTTVINLLMRFYDPDNGIISVEDKNIKNVTRASLRKSYGMVLQETWLKSATVKENIAFGKPDATDEEIIEAAKKAHAHNFITRLKNGYNTVIGDGGGNISEGQKQLLCIARVMLCLPPILILDEATSSIDTRTELKIQKAFSIMMKGRTSFIVAHRLSTIREADIILVMRDGKIIETGCHDELLKNGGFYADLYNSQFDKTGETK